MTNTALAALAPSIPDHIEEPNHRRRCATSALAGRLRRIAEEMRTAEPGDSILLDRLAWRLFRCAQAGKSRTGWRCGASYCPRCSRQTAIKYRKRLQRRMRSRAVSGAAPHGFAMLTLTVAGPNPVRGYQILRDARARFCRERLACAAIAGGEGHVDVKPVHGAESDAWNAHLHALVELKYPRGLVDTGALRVAWAETLARFGARGSFDLRQYANLKPGFFRNGRG
jgi:hypothetical protein